MKTRFNISFYSNNLKAKSSNFKKALKICLFSLFFSFVNNGWGQTTIFTESMGTVAATTTISAHETANGFDNDGFTMDQGGATNPGDIRASAPVSTGYTGASGGAFVWLTTTNAQYGFAINGIDASSYTSLQLSYGYYKNSGTAHATFSVDYWNGSSWINVANTAAALFNEASGAALGWYAAKTLSLPVGAQINGLKIRFSKTGTNGIRIDDIKLVGTAAATPTLTATASSLTGFTYVQGSGPSAVQSFALTGSNLNGTNVTLTTSTNYEISTSNTPFTATSPITLTAYNGASTTIYVRLKAGLSAGNYNSENVVIAGGGATSINETNSGSVTAAPTPTLTATANTLTGFTYVFGAGPSTVQSFTLTGSNLSGTDVTLTPPTNYEISTSNSPFAATSPITLTAYNGASTTIYVRLKAGLAVGSYNSENVVIAGGGATSINETNSGSVTAASKKILFDASSGQSLSSADWIVDADASNAGWNSSGTCHTSGTEYLAQRYPTPGTPTAESDWSGGNSRWAYELYLLGYTIESLGPCQDITYGDAGNPQDLSNYNVFICNEPNVQFTAAEKTAILAFVNAGGGLYMGADHGDPNPTTCAGTEADRNCDGWNSTEVWNDLMSTNPFGIQFNQDNTASPTSSNKIASDPILSNTAGTVTSISFNQGATMVIDNCKNATAHGVIFMTGTTLPATDQAMVAAASYGSGRVVGVGDSSPSGDATGDTNGETRNNNWIDANNGTMILNASIWLAEGSARLVVGTSCFTGFTYSQGSGPSSSQTFVLNGYGFSGSGNITVSPSTNYEVSTDGTTWSGSTITYAYASGIITGQPKTVYVRLKAGLAQASYNNELVTISGGSATTINVTCSGTVTPPASPTLSASVSTLTGFTYVEGAGPSTFQSYNLSGTSLTGAPGNIVVTAPTDYLVCLTSGGTYTTSVNVAYASSTLASTPIYVKLKSGLTAASSPYNNENISNAGGGATTINVACSGTVTAASSSCATDLIISEYGEGSSNNKYIELYNKTGASVDLSIYTIKYDNGGDGTWEASPLALSGTLADATTYVIKNSSASASIIADLSTTNAALTFNGNDPVGLFKSGVLIDLCGPQDASTWGANMTLVRNSSITSPSTTSNISSDWTQYASDTWTYVGDHSMPCTAAPEINIQENSTSYASASIFAFGSVNLGSSSATKTFTIQNTGTAALAISGAPKVDISGTNAADFTIDQTSTSASVAASGTTTFTITFTPSSVGAKTAAISIANDDTNENPYVINLTGTGVCLTNTITFGALTAKTYGDATFNLSATATSGTVTYASSNTAVATVSGSTVTIVGAGSTNITASCAANGNYCAATDVPQTLTVNAKTLTISGASASNKTYDGSNTATITGGSLVGIVGADVVTLTQSGTFGSVNVGTGIAVTSTSTIGGANAANYTLTQPSGLTANITAKALTVTSDNISKVFGNTLTSGAGKTTFTSSGLVGIETIGSITLTYGTGAAAGDAIGTYIGTSVPSAATGGTFSAGNYSISYVAGNIIVTPAPTISTSGSLTAVNTTYGTASASPTSFAVSGTNMSEGILVTPPAGYEVCLTVGGTYTATVTVGAAGTIASTTVYVRLKATTAVGSYAGNIVCSSSGATSVNVATVSSTVSAKAISITANDVSKPFGNTLTGGSGSTAFTSSGLANSETIGTVTITYGTGAAAGDAVGTYANQVTPSAATGGTFTASNYTITYLTGTITVTAATPANLFFSEYAGKGYAADFNDEYFEITNNGGSAQDLTGWTLEYYNNAGTLEGGAQSLTGSIAANSAYLIAARTTGGTINGISPNFTCSGVSLNDNGYIILKNSVGTIIDQAGSSSDKFADNGNNYEFVNCTEDNSTVVSWSNLGGTSPACNGTPGVVNCSTTPIISQSTTTISGFSYGEGFGPSSNQTYTISGANLTGDITVTASANYEVSTSSGSGFGASVTLTQSSGSVNTTTIYVRQIAGLAAGAKTGTSTASSSGATNKVVNLSGTVVAKSVTLSTTTLSGFTYAEGGGPSAEQSFTISGIALTGNLTITAPADYQISTGTGGSFVATSPITLTPTNGVVGTTTIYVRLKSGLLNSASPFNGENIVCASSGLTNQNVSCSGTVTVPIITFSVASASVAENGVTYTITVTSDFTGSHTANIALTGGTATNGSQFSYSSPIQATFAGSTTFTTNVTINDDGTCSGASTTAIFSLNTLSGCNVGTNGTLTLTITDNDLVSGVLYSHSFEGSLADNWGYTGSGVIASDFNMKLPSSGGHSFKMGQGASNIIFDNVNITGFTNVSISVTYAGASLGSGDDLNMSLSYDGGTVWETPIKLIDGYGSTDLNIGLTRTSSPQTTIITQTTNPYVFSIPDGSQTQVRVRFSSASNDASSFHYVDNVSISRTACNVCSEPTANSTMSATTNVTTNSATLNWSGGDGSAKLILMKETTNIIDAPVDGTTYLASAAFGTAGSELGNSFVVYKNASTTMNVTNLTPGKEYKVKMWDYNCLPGTENYLLTSPGSTQFITMPQDPVSFTESCIANTNITFTWGNPTLGGYNGFIIVARQTSTPESVSSLDPSTQTFNTDFSIAPTYGTNSKVVYKGSALTTQITGLTTGATYRFIIYTYKTISAGYYKYSAGSTMLTNTMNLPNVTSPYAQKGDSQGTITWTNPTSGCFDEIMIVTNEASGITFSPSGDGSSYTANSVYGGANSVVYKGTGTSVTVTGLTNETWYYFEIFTRKGTEWSSGVEVSCKPNLATILYPADVAIIAVNTSIAGTYGGMSNCDEVCFISFKDITDVTAIDFTDNGYNRSFEGYFGDGEGTIRLQRISGGTITAGTPICFKGCGTETYNGDFDIFICGVNDNVNWVVSSLNGNNNYDLNATGDQIWIMQNGNWDTDVISDKGSYTGNLLYGWTSTGWKPNVGTTAPNWPCCGDAAGAGSMLCPEADCFNTQVSASSSDKVKYIGALTAASQSDWISRINDNTNWAGYADNAAYNAGPNYSGSCISFSVTGTIDHTGSSAGLWVGTSGTDWFNCNNWADKIVPNQTTNVRIPASAADNVVIDDGLPSEASCNNITLESPAITTTMNHANSVLNIHGNFINDGSFIATLGTVKFKGTAAQSISGAISTTTFNDLHLNNTSATGLTLNSDIAIKGKFSLIDGILYSKISPGLITMNAGSSVHSDVSASNNISGSLTSFVDGPIKKIGNTAFTFPTGDVISGTPKWARIGISAPSNATTEYTAEYIRTSYSDTTTTIIPNLFYYVSAMEYWNLNQAINNDDVAVKLFWEDDDYSGINDCDGTPDDLRIAHYNGTDWELNIDEAIINCGASGDITTTSVQPSFSPFTFASKSKSKDINPLPVTLLNFNAIRTGKHVNVDWTTSSEINNDFFTVERSKDAVNFEVAFNTNGAGNSSSILNYRETDYFPFTEISYYRLKQTDFDGKYTYSKIVPVHEELSKNNNNVIFFQNEKKIKIHLKNLSDSGFHIEVIDMLGKVLFREEHQLDAKDNVIEIDSRSFPPGIYNLSIVSSTSINTKKFVIH